MTPLIRPSDLYSAGVISDELYVRLVTAETDARKLSEQNPDDENLFMAHHDARELVNIADELRMKAHKVQS